MYSIDFIFRSSQFFARVTEFALKGIGIRPVKIILDQLQPPQDVVVDSSVQNPKRVPIPKMPTTSTIDAATMAPVSLISTEADNLPAITTDAETMPVIPAEAASIPVIATDPIEGEKRLSKRKASEIAKREILSMPKKKFAFHFENHSYAILLRLT